MERTLRAQHLLRSNRNSTMRPKSLSAKGNGRGMTGMRNSEACQRNSAGMQLERRQRATAFPLPMGLALRLLWIGLRALPHPPSGLIGFGAPSF